MGAAEGRKRLWCHLLGVCQDSKRTQPQVRVMGQEELRKNKMLGLGILCDPLLVPQWCSQASW